MFSVMVWRFVVLKMLIGCSYDLRAVFKRLRILVFIFKNPKNVTPPSTHPPLKIKRYHVLSYIIVDFFDIWAIFAIG